MSGTVIFVKNQDTSLFIFTPKGHNQIF